MRSKLVSFALGCTLAAGLAGRAQAQPQSGGIRSRSGARLALQARLDALNLFGVPSLTDPSSTTIVGDARGTYGVVPLATAGVRFAEDRVFLGVGFGFYGYAYSVCDDSDRGCDERETTTSTNGWAVTPLVGFDLLRDREDLAALSLVGWLNLGGLGGSKVEVVRPDRTDTTTLDGAFWWGANIGIGLRAMLSRALAIGTEWGWGFQTSTSDGDRTGPGDDRTAFAHGIWGTLAFEASLGL